MHTTRPNSRDITRKLRSSQAQARPYAQLVALTQHHRGPTVHWYREPNLYPDGPIFMSYEHGDYHVETCGSTTDDAAQALLKRLNSDTGYLLQPTPLTGATHPAPRRALSR